MTIVIIIAVFLPTVLPASGLSLSVNLTQGEKTKAILAAGDAITSGKGLDDRAGKSYGSLVASGLGISGGKYCNIAEDYMTSAELSEKLLYAELYVKDADLMIISVGTDDIMNIVTTAIEMTAEGGKMSYSRLLAYAADAEFIKKLSEAIDHTAILNAVSKFPVNIGDIIARVRGFNPDIRIVFLSLYNPLDGSSALAPMKSILDSPIEMMNTALKKTSEDSGCGYIDLSTAFSGKADIMTNITSLDVNPNADGHKLIADLLKDYISSLPDLSDKTEPPVTTGFVTEPPANGTDEISETTAQPSDYKWLDDESHLWVYIVIAAIVSSAGIAIGIYSVKSKPKNK